MSDEKLNFLDGPGPAETGGVSAAEAAAAASADPHLREDGHVPISALLDERERRQAEQMQREALERQIAEIRFAQPPIELSRDEQFQVALYSQNLRASRKFAEREHGKDTVAAVHNWATRRCDQDPHFNRQMLASEDPYEAALHAYHREQILQTVKPDDLAGFKAWQAGQTASPHAAVPHRSPFATAVPRSLATASGTGAAGGRHGPIGPGQAFASTITR